MLTLLALAAHLLATAPLHAGRTGMGVGALDSNAIVVRIDGRESAFTLAGLAAGSGPATAFLKCLVAGRVLRVNGSSSAATATLLDDTSVADHVKEFLESRTSMDPCALGKAAYKGHT